MVKKKKTDLIQEAKDTAKLGMLTGLGTYAFGRVGAAHPATAPVAGAAVAGLQIAQVGQLAKTGLAVVDMFGNQQMTKKKKTGSKEVDKMLGF